jgi:NAD(P)-dependent dehydrogenase (short-subunit alcohol dehydrogenase family)
MLDLMKPVGPVGTLVARRISNMTAPTHARRHSAEWAARGVRINAVAPTYVETSLNAFAKNNPPMFNAWIGGTPMARLGRVDEIASVALFLASDAASLMAGSIVLVDGGYTCW